MVGAIYNENHPFANFIITLKPHPSNQISKLQCQSPESECILILSHKIQVCETTSGPDGKFKFIAIPLGKYLILYTINKDEEKHIIEIEPNYTEIEVTAKPLEFK